jgi:gliding motility-associated lipoprotein GldD
MKNLIIGLFTLLSITFFACEPIFTPKPKGFNAINLPKHQYQLWADSSKPYLFEKNNIAVVENYITHTIKETDKYIIIDYPTLGGKCYLTYKKIGNNIDTLNSLIMNSFRLADGHNVKASGMDSEIISLEKNRYATSIIIEGEVSSQYQFYLHDSTNNFIRAALYFETATKNDSLAPVIDYVKEDMNHIIETIEWKDAK